MQDTNSSPANARHNHEASDQSLIADRQSLQDICATIAAQVECGISIMGQGGVVLASSIENRIGKTHAGARRIMAGEIDRLEVDEIAADQSDVMLEGYNLPIELDGQRVASIGVAAPVKEARNYAAIVQTCVAAMLRERRNNQRALQDQDVRLQSIIESSSDWVWVTDENLRFCFLSDRFYQLFKLTPEQIIGKTREEFIGPEAMALDAAKWQSHRDDIAARRRIKEFAYNVVVPGGKTLCIKINGSAYYRSDGSFAGYHGTGTDNTELRQAQEQLLQNEKMAVLLGLVSGIAHEINTPIGNTVTASSQLLDETVQIRDLLDRNALSRRQLNDYLDDNQQLSTLVLENAQRAAQLVSSFKQVAIDQSEEANTIRSFDLQQALTSIQSQLKPQVQSRGHQLHLECPTQPLLMRSRPGALYQVISHLVSNSLSHGFNAIAHGSMSLKASVHNDQVIVIYEDNGIGMAGQEIRRIFEPFFTTARFAGKSGLGMYLVYNLVTHSLHGKIHGENRPGGGIRFQLELPRELKPEQ